MKHLTALFLIASVLAFSIPATTWAQYNQATTNLYAMGTNPVEKSATAAPHDLQTFTNYIALAFATNSGGIFNIPVTFANGARTFRGTYGLSYDKALNLTFSAGMQPVTASGSFVAISGTYGITTTVDLPSYTMAVGPITDPVSGIENPSETITHLGFTVLSRTHATYPLDIRATISVTDGSTQTATAAIGNPKAADDTFFAFSVAPKLAITNLLLEAFATGTENPVSTRIAIDDIAFAATSTGLNPVPQITSVRPFKYAIIPAADGLQFDAASVLPLYPTNLTLLLNATDVSSQLVVSNLTPTNVAVSFSNLLPDQKYDLFIGITNQAGGSFYTARFYTHSTVFPLFDSGGFTDDTLYPLGPLTAVTNGESFWAPALEPSTIIDSGDPAHGKVMQRMQMGNDQNDFLYGPFLASGIMIYSFDARVSDPSVRTLDTAFMPATGGLMASFLMFGTNKVNHYNGSAWVPVADMDANWHHFTVTNFISGRYAGSFDLSMDGNWVGNKLVWREAVPPQTPMGRFRFGAIRGGVTQYGEVDNIQVFGAPALPVPLPVTLHNQVRSASAFSFSFNTQTGFSYVIKSSPAIDAATWTTLDTLPGTGGTLSYTNPIPDQAQFYRVETQ